MENYNLSKTSHKDRKKLNYFKPKLLQEIYRDSQQDLLSNVNFVSTNLYKDQNFSMKSDRLATGYFHAKNFH